MAVVVLELPVLTFDCLWCPNNVAICIAAHLRLGCFCYFKLQEIVKMTVTAVFNRGS